MNNNRTIWLICQYAAPPKYSSFGFRQFFLAKEWVKKGYKVYIMASNFNHYIYNSPPNESIYNLENIEGVDFLWIRTKKYDNPSGLMRIIGWLQFMFRLFFIPFSKIQKPDVLIISTPSLFSFLSTYYFKLKFKVSKIILEVRDIWPLTIITVGNYSKYHPFILLLRWIEIFSYKKSGLIVGTMPKLNEHVKETLGTDKFNYISIPQGIDMDFIQESEKISFDELKIELPKDKFIVGYAGTIGPANSLETFIEVAKELKNNTSIHFALLGGGHAKDEIIKLAENSPNISFLPKVKKEFVLSFLKQCNVLYDSVKDISLYKYGLSRNKWMDYMYSAKPMLISYSGFVSIINDAQNGKVVKAEDITALKNSILEMYENQAELQTMGERGKKYILENHTYKILADKFEKQF